MRPDVALSVVSVLPAAKSADGRLLLTRKFVDGLREYRRHWGNRIVVYTPPGVVPSGSLDEVRLRPEELPCEIVILPPEHVVAAITDGGASLAMLSLDDFQQLGIARECRARGVPYVYVSEYSLKTRWQIVDATTSNPLKRLRRRLWERGQERKRLRALTGAVGLQCNGTPTYEDYKAICSNALLFFDTRVTAAMLASEYEVRQKYAVSNADRTLRLLFSGRLVAMKGVMDLISVARELKKLKVDFHLSICGDGNLAGSLEQAIRAHDLSAQINLEGVLDFACELVPLVKRSIDLFVCCHPQGDPSCTYLETMACGVPIAGYANDAFAGVVQHSGAGWLSPLNRPDLLAAEIQRAAASPGAMGEMALRALRFAADHTFEREFARRTEQIRLLAERAFPGG